MPDHRSTEPPDWFRAGKALESVRARTPDHQGVLAVGFAGVGDGDWRECMVPVAHLACGATTLKHEVLTRPRSQGIRKWIRECGGIMTALAEAPLVITIREGQIEVEDGYHRLCLAVFEHGATHVRAVCAMLPSE